MESYYYKGQRLSETELLPDKSVCPICSYTGSRRTVVSLQNDPDVYLLACRCGCMSASRMPRQEILQDYYSRYYADGNSTATFDGSDRFAQHLFRSLGVIPKKKLRILDFGGGVDATISRSLAQQFLKNGTEHVAIALVDYNASCQREWGAIDVDCYRDLQDVRGKFDVVLASAIVEHMPSPRDTLLGLLSALCEDGRAYFRTPSMSSIIKLAARFGVHIDFTYPAHLHDMGQAFWENLLPTLDVSRRFSLIRSRPAIVETEFSIHPSRTLIAYAFKSLWFLFGSRYTIVGGWEAVIASKAEKSRAPATRIH